jgi:hypothetical protein
MAFFRNPSVSHAQEAFFHHPAERGCTRRSPNQLTLGRPISGAEFAKKMKKKWMIKER